MFSFLDSMAVHWEYPLCQKKKKSGFGEPWIKTIQVNKTNIAVVLSQVTVDS